MKRGFNGEFSGHITGCGKFLIVLIVLISALFPFSTAGAETTGQIDKADTAWILVATALVMFMTPGLAYFYAGMVRRKNILDTLMHSFFILCLISVQWVLWGYTLAFGPDKGGIIGGLDYIGLIGVGMEANGTIPHILFMMFQGTFAVITVALITGSFVERMKFSAAAVFALLWATLVYDPLCHWVWGGGWMQDFGTLDFAGGMVVHISCGVSALVAALVVGKRRGWPRELMPPHNLGLTVIGMGVLWFGWFGFNAGSALAADGIAANALVTTNTAAATATLTWVFIEWAHRGQPTLLGAVSGAVAGLGTITPASGYVGPGSAIIIGLGAGSLCYWAVGIIKPRLGYDDTLDVFGIHGVGGMLGTLCLGLFASIGAKGLFFGDPAQFVKQLVGVISTVVFAGVMTFVLLKAVDAVIGLRVTNDQEVEGLDLAQHGESGYNL